ncbi:MAG: hypothetical protein PVS2B2_14770 [Candidatus Acidiferrum sp.]
MRRTLGQMQKGLTLHVNERAFARGMHHFEDKFAAIGGFQMKVVIVLAGE